MKLAKNLMLVTDGLAAVLVTLLITSGTSFGQTTGTVLGTVKDPSGDVVPQVMVRVIQEETGVKRLTTTNGTGNYGLAELPVGHYTLEVEREGFKKYQRKDIDIPLGRVVVVDLSLGLGAETQ